MGQSIERDVLKSLFDSHMDAFLKAWKTRAKLQGYYNKKGQLTQKGMNAQADFVSGAVAALDLLHGTTQSVISPALYFRVLRGEDIASE